MEDEGGFKALVDDVLATMKKEDVVKTTRLNKVIVSAHSGGYWPAAHALEKGGLADRVSDVFLFDAFYSCQQYFGKWLTGSHGFLQAAYTDHLAPEHLAFEKGLTGEPRQRLTFTHTSVNHDKVIQSFFAEWLGHLDPGWKMDPR